jgi:hypothetical protein
VEAHLFWRLDSGRELELVVSDVDSDAVEAPSELLRSATGRVRMADLRGPDSVSVDAAARDLRLADAVAIEEPMGWVAVVNGSHRLVPGFD